MLVGVPKEIKVHEYRVGLTPASVRELVTNGHKVLVQTGAGEGAGMSDQDYLAAGAQIAPDAASVFAKADMIVKVKEPQLPECKMLRPGQILFTYLHLAPDPEQAKALMQSGAVARTSTLALNNATLPYTLVLANKGWQQATAEDAGLKNGLNVCDGKIVHAAVAEALNLPLAA